MPSRFTHSVPFVVNGQRFVQVGDAGHCCWCLVPAEPYDRVQYVIDALNLKDAADTLAVSTAIRLARDH